jgi:hypothetical protein
VIEVGNGFFNVAFLSLGITPVSVSGGIIWKGRRRICEQSGYRKLRSRFSFPPKQFPSHSTLIEKMLYNPRGERGSEKRAIVSANFSERGAEAVKRGSFSTVSAISGSRGRLRIFEEAARAFEMPGGVRMIQEYKYKYAIICS